ATVREHYNPVATMLAEMPKPVIAAVRGMAAGAGASLAMLADFRIGGPGTGFLTAARALASRLASGPTITYGQIKRQLRIGGTGTLAEALDAEYDAQRVSG